MRAFATLIILFLSLSTFGQSPNKARKALDDGRLLEAKKQIDKAITNSNLMQKAKTWYYRGMIYAELDKQIYEPGAMEEAIKSYNRALELDPEQKSISEKMDDGIVDADSRIQSYYSHYYIKAVDNYQNDEYEDAADNFEKAFYIMPSDSNSVLNAAYSAIAIDDDDRAINNLEKAIDAGVRDLSIFLTLYNYAVEAQDLTLAMRRIRAARKYYPNDAELMKFEINILIDQGKIGEAKALIRDAIYIEPGNPDLYFSLAVIYDQSGDKESARVNYKRAIDSDPDHYNSNYNLAALFFNEAYHLIRQLNDTPEGDQERISRLNREINESLRKAKPYFETIYKQDSEDLKVLEWLEFIYTRLDLPEKAAKMTRELEALGPGN